MRRLRRLIPGSARVPRVWRRRPRHRELSNPIENIESNEEKKFAIAGRARQHAWTRALPGVSHPRGLVASILVIVFVVIAFAWWLPIPNELQKSSSGTLTL